MRGKDLKTAALVFNDPDAHVDEDYAHSTMRYIKGADYCRIISARPADEAEIRAYEEMKYAGFA